MKENSKRKSMIHVRGAFSELIGITSCVMKMQYDDFDERTRMQISNTLYNILEFFFEKAGGFNSTILYHGDYRKNSGDADFSSFIVSEVFNRRINLEAGYVFDWRRIYDELHKVIEEATYNEVLDVVWISCNWIADNYQIYSEDRKNFMYDIMNDLFEKEFVGYRFIAGKIIQITDKNEIKEIEEAVHSPFEGCNTHIANAVALLADRERKDYKNSIKESISAVESICKVIVGKDNAQLGDMLKILESKRGLKGQLKSGFEKLYNYTNDKGGIRHADGLFVSNVSFEEAKFMLVSCSAFVNYLIAEYGKIKED